MTLIKIHKPPLIITDFKIRNHLSETDFIDYSHVKIKEKSNYILHLIIQIKKIQSLFYMFEMK